MWLWWWGTEKLSEGVTETDGKCWGVSHLTFGAHTQHFSAREWRGRFRCCDFVGSWWRLVSAAEQRNIHRHCLSNSTGKTNKHLIIFFSNKMQHRKHTQEALFSTFYWIKKKQALLSIDLCYKRLWCIFFFRRSSLDSDCGMRGLLGPQHQNSAFNDVFAEPTDCHAAQCPIHQRYGRCMMKQVQSAKVEAESSKQIS